MRFVTMTVLAATAISGCVKKVETTLPFRAEQAAFIEAPGTNSITGQAFMRQAGGGVVTCAANPVYLVPRTDYAVERMLNIYGKSENPGRQLLGVIPDDPDPGYLRLSRDTICDAEGDFEFFNVPDGEYFVTTGVFWMINQYFQDGANLMHPIKVEAGETKSLLISP